MDWLIGLKEQFILNFIEGKRWEFLLIGFVNTILITVVSAILGIIIGIVVATIRTTYDNNVESLQKKGGVGYYAFSVVNAICKLYLTVVRGTPVVVQLLIMYFIIFATSNNGLMVAMLAFGINSGAYVAEIFRSGIMSIEHGQLEAGRSLGFNYYQTMFYIILPQAVKNVLPTLLNEFIALLKETSIAGYVGIMDLTKAGNNIRNHTYSPFMPLIAVALVYLVLVVLLTWVVGKLERRLRKGERHKHRSH